MDNRNFTYMFYGFAAAWTILALYVVTLALRESRLKTLVDTLRHMIDDKEKPQ